MKTLPLALLSLLITTSSPADLWDDSDPIQPQGWRSSDWFGNFAPISLDGGWLFHDAHNWLYAVGDNTNDLYLYGDKMEWVYTNQSTYPFLYSFKNKGWIWYDEGTKAPREFTNMETGDVLGDDKMGGRAPDSLHGKTIFLSSRGRLGPDDGTPIGNRDGFTFVRDSEVGSLVLNDDGEPGDGFGAPGSRHEFAKSGHGFKSRNSGVFDGIARLTYDDAYTFEKVSPHEIKVRIPLASTPVKPTEMTR